MSEPNIFKKRLREIRTKLGLSQKALGIQIGIDPFSASPRMNQYERGKHLPDLLTIGNLANEVGVPMAYFFAEDDELAELLELWGRLEASDRTVLVKAVRQRVNGE